MQGDLIMAADPKKKDRESEDPKADSSEPEMVYVRLGGKWQYITKEMLEQARKVMKTLEPLEREVLKRKFGLPPEYFDEPE